MQWLLERFFPLFLDGCFSPALPSLAFALLLTPWQLLDAAPDDPAPLPFELTDVVLVCDASGDRILTFHDADSSGAVETDLGEIGVFYDDSSPGPDLSTPSHLAPGPDGGVLLLDGGTLDQVLLLRDRNLDGDSNDDGEISVYYDDSTGGPSLYTPNTLLPAESGGFYVSDDGSRARRILWLGDLDESGDALGAGESRVVYDSSALSSPLLEDVESLAETEDGVLLVGDSTLEAIFALEDLDGDGTFLGEDEVRLYFQGTVDLPLGDVEAICRVEDAVYACERESGRILRLSDGNADGDAADPGEATIFLDDTVPGAFRDVTDLIALPEGGLLAIDNASDTLRIVQDLNGDGDALDEFEVVRWLLDDGEALALPMSLLRVPGGGIQPPLDPTFIRGDGTSDGLLDVSDAIFTLNFLFLAGGLPECFDALDADDTGDLNVTDSIWTLNFLFLGGPPPPPPFPEAGVDPTQDSLDC